MGLQGALCYNLWVLLGGGHEVCHAACQWNETRIQPIKVSRLPANGCNDFGLDFRPNL